MQTIVTGKLTTRLCTTAPSPHSTRRSAAAAAIVRPAEQDLSALADDGLRGLGLEQTRDNLHEMIAMGRSAGARLLLLGVRLPQNYGRDYGEKFHRIYLDLAGQHGVALVPFFLAGVAETRAMMQPDGIHPGAEAQPRILDNIWPQLVPLLQPGE